MMEQMITALRKIGDPDPEWEESICLDSLFLSAKDILEVHQVLSEHSLLGFDAKDPDSQAVLAVVQVLEKMDLANEAIPILIKGLNDFEASFNKTALWGQLEKMWLDCKGREPANITRDLLALRFETGLLFGEEQGISPDFSKRLRNIDLSAFELPFVLPETLEKFLADQLDQWRVPATKYLAIDRIVYRSGSESILRIHRLLSGHEESKNRIISALANGMRTLVIPYSCKSLDARSIDVLASISHRINRVDAAYDILSVGLSQAPVDGMAATKGMRELLQKISSKGFLPPAQQASLLALRFELEGCHQEGSQSHLPGNPVGNESMATNLAITGEPWQRLAGSMAYIFLDTLGKYYIQGKSRDGVAVSLLKIAQLPTHDCDVRKKITVLARALLAQLSRTPLGAAPNFSSQAAASALESLTHASAMKASLDARKTSALNLLKQSGCSLEFQSGSTSSLSGKQSCELQNFETEEQAKALTEYIEACCQLGEMPVDLVFSYLGALLPHTRICAPPKLFGLCLAAGSAHPDLFLRKEFKKITSDLLANFSHATELLNILKKKFFLTLTSFRDPYSSEKHRKQDLKVILQLGAMLLKHHEIFRLHWPNHDDFRKYIEDMDSLWKISSDLLRGSRCAPVVKSFSLIPSFRREVKEINIEINQVLETMIAMNDSENPSWQTRLEAMNLAFSALQNRGLSLRQHIQILQRLTPFIGPQNPDLLVRCPDRLIFFLAAHARLLGGLPIAATDELHPLVQAFHSISVPAEVLKTHALTHVVRLASAVASSRVDDLNLILPSFATSPRIDSFESRKLLPDDDVERSLLHLQKLAILQGDVTTASKIVDLLTLRVSLGSTSPSLQHTLSLINEQTRLQSLQGQL